MIGTIGDLYSRGKRGEWAEGVSSSPSCFLAFATDVTLYVTTILSDGGQFRHKLLLRSP